MVGEALISAVVNVDITAVSSIVHRDDSRTGTSVQSVFRREKVLTPAGEVVVVPIVSGNGWRAVLRRIGETLLAPVLDYGGELTPAAAHLLRNGGFLRASATDFTPAQQRELTTLVPVVGIFGGAINAKIVGGKLVVSKVVPVTADTTHLIAGPPPETGGRAVPVSVMAVLGQESTSHTPDVSAAADVAAVGAFDPLRLDTETLIAGTWLRGQLRLTHATACEYALFTDIVDTFATDGHLGGRIAAGHGRIRAQTHTTITAGDPDPGHDWRTEVAAGRDKALALLATVH